jgi:arylsulfatase A-like enzyme
LTTATDLAPTILDLLGLSVPEGIQGRSFREVLVGGREEHRPFVVSSWPLYFAEGELTTAVDSRPRRIARYMPLTVTTRSTSLILGGPTEEPELYDLEADPAEQVNTWTKSGEEGRELARGAVAFLEDCGTPERYLEPRKSALRTFAP